MTFGCSKIVTVLLLLLNLAVLSRAQTSAQAKALRTQLFTTDGYDKKVRPSLDQSVATEVFVSFYLLAINELDEVAETLKTTGWLLVEWTDQHLVWNASDYGGIELSFWPQDDIWKPDVALKNSYKEYKELGASALNVQVDQQGHVTWSPFQVFVSTCSISVEYFPFDTQTCYLRFVAWSYTKEQVIMEGGSKGIELEQYSPNSAWEVKDTSWGVEWESGEASIKFTLKIKRKPMFIILNTLLPIMMLAILNLLVFLLPCESGEKAGYAVTVFLAFAVFMTIISTTLPENSDTTSWFSIYVVLLTVQSTLITTIALVMVRMSTFSNNTKIPGVLIGITKLAKCRPCKGNQRGSVSPEPSENSTDVKKIDLQSLDGSTDVGQDTDTQFTWNEAMNALDQTLLIFFSVVFITASIVCMVSASSKAI